MRRRLFAAGLLIPETKAEEPQTPEHILSRVTFDTSADDREEKIALCKHLLLGTKEV
jgi:glutamate racemase